MTIIYAGLLFALMIFPHELGHFLAAKSVGVKVNEFAFGMGPALLKKQGKETLYSLRLIPVGGYCAMEGEDEESEDQRGFSNKPAWAKIFILFSGAGMNILIAVLSLSIMLGTMGMATTTLGTVNEAMPAYEAGIREGDKITEVSGEAVDSWAEAVMAIREAEEKEVTITVERNGEAIDFDVTPVKGEDGKDIIGIQTRVSHNPIMALKAGAIGTKNLTVYMVGSLKDLITGKVPASNMAGPVGIINMASDTAKYGMTYFASLIALMSINLALINLLPFPALDGGRILFVLIRKVTGKRITEEMEGKIHTIGIMMLFGLMIFVTWNDIVRLFS